MNHETSGRSLQSASHEIDQALAAAIRLTARLLSGGIAAIVVRQDGLDRLLASHGLSEADSLAVPALAASYRDPDNSSFPSLPSGTFVSAAVPLGTDTERPIGIVLGFARAENPACDTGDREILADLAAIATGLIASSPVVTGREALFAPQDLLADAIEALPEAVALFDQEDRFVLWNHRFQTLYGGADVALTKGMRFADHLASSIATGHVPAAVGREAEWIAGRLARFAAAEGAYEHQLQDGRWVRVQDRALAHGGTIGIRSDITHLVNRERSFRLLFDANPAPMIILDRQSLKILAVNDAALTFYGYDRETFLRLTLPDIRPEGRSGEIKGMIARLDDPALAEQLRRHVTASGEERIVKVNARVLDHDGHEAVLAAIFDMTEQQKLADDVRRARAFLRDVVDHIPATVFVKDMWDEGRYVIYNKAGEALVGRPRSLILGRTDAEVFETDDAERFVGQDRDALHLSDAVTLEDEIVRRPDGSGRWIRTRKVALMDGSEKRPRYVLGIAEDVTELRASEALIAHRAYHDGLTDLANRTLFRDRLEAALRRAGEAEAAVAVLLIDLDGFKAVNDNWGHATGDGLLQLVADRLRDLIRGTDTAARLGGDEFAVVQAPIRQAGEAAWLAGRLIAALANPYVVGGHELKVSASIGIGVALTADADPDVLLKSADFALYEAKRAGRNQFRFAANTPEAGLDRGVPAAPRLLRY